MGIPMLKIRRSRDRLIFNIGIPILVWRHYYIETAPWRMSLGSSNIWAKEHIGALMKICNMICKLIKAHKHDKCSHITDINITNAAKKPLKLLLQPWYLLTETDKSRWIQWIMRPSICGTFKTRDNYLYFMHHLLYPFRMFHNCKMAS